MLFCQTLAVHIGAGNDAVPNCLTILSFCLSWLRSEVLSYDIANDRMRSITTTSNAHRGMALAGSIPEDRCSRLHLSPGCLIESYMVVPYHTTVYAIRFQVIASLLRCDPDAFISFKEQIIFESRDLSVSHLEGGMLATDIKGPSQTGFPRFILTAFDPYLPKFTLHSLCFSCLLLELLQLL